MKKLVFILFPIFATVSYSDICKAEKVPYGLMRWYYFPGLGKKTIFRRSTLTIGYDKEYIGTWIEELLYSVEDNINNELGGIVAVAFVPIKKNTCHTRDGVSEVCFNMEDDQFKPRGRKTPIGTCFWDGQSILDTAFNPKWNGYLDWARTYFPDDEIREGSGSFPWVPSNTAKYLTGEVKEATIVIWEFMPHHYLFVERNGSPVAFQFRSYQYLFDVLKHELLHSFGFGHVESGIMLLLWKITDLI